MLGDGEAGLVPRVARAAWILVVASLAIALATTVWFVVVTLPVRLPYWGEAEVVFEASRIRANLPLYVDPHVGALEYGSPPSRFYVTYPPLWTWVVSWVPDRAALVVARIACTSAWFGSLVTVAWTARRGLRVEAFAAAAFVAGIWVLANFATIGRPDSIACAVAALALARTVRRGTIDALGVGLFVLVPWIKPTLIGLPVGALLGAALVSRQAARRVLGSAALLGLGTAAIAHVASGGSLFAHVIRSNAQPFSSAAWLDQVPARLPFFAPLFAWAGWTGWRDRSTPGTRIGLAALAGAIVWTFLALAKTGSSSNYWMEPCVAAVVLVARTAPGPVRIGSGRLVHALAALGAVAWADVASVRASLEHARTMRAASAFVARTRERVGLMPADVVAADEAGIELALNGRILTPTYQMVHLVRAGTYPASLWISDLIDPKTRCYIEHTHQLRLAPELARTLQEKYVVRIEEAGFTVWMRRDDSPER